MAEEEDRQLGESFRQSRKELWFMLVTWIVFAVWTGGYNGLFASKSGEEVKILFGFPQWIVIGILIPWILATVITIWFAFFYMKDCRLDPVEGENGHAGGEEDSAA